MEKTPAVEAFWRRFGVEAPYDVWYFGDSAPLSDELLALVLAGKKTATCGLVWEHGAPESPPPVLHGYSVVTDFHGAPRAVLQTTGLRTVPFGQVDEAFALAEGEGTFDQWRAAHWAYFQRRCALIGKEPSDAMPVVCERFKVVFPLQPR